MAKRESAMILSGGTERGIEEAEGKPTPAERKAMRQALRMDREYFRKHPGVGRYRRDYIPGELHPVRVPPGDYAVTVVRLRGRSLAGQCWRARLLWDRAELEADDARAAAVRAARNQVHGEAGTESRFR